MKRSRNVLAHVAGTDMERALWEFIVYAAMVVTTQPSQLSRLWHETEVRLSKSFKQAMDSPQQKE